MEICSENWSKVAKNNVDDVRMSQGSHCTLNQCLEWEKRVSNKCTHFKRWFTDTCSMVDGVSLHVIA